MWTKGWRDRIWSILDTKWDLIIIGGGITGAGILLEAVRAGLRPLLLEAHDFASGTSSRSSKLVHGGFRYLKNGQIKMTFDSVRERERLLKEGRGLINPLGFLLATYKGDTPPKWMLGFGLVLYDIIAMKWGHRFYNKYDLKELCPLIEEENLTGGYRYFDALTDDSRLVLRLIREANSEGAVALNYTKVIGLLRQSNGTICGVVAEDKSSDSNGSTIEIFTPVVINATGAWVDEINSQVEGKTRCLPQIRKLRGSHLVFPASRFPLSRSISRVHPDDQRYVFAFPWEGVTVVGTTDVDYQNQMTTNPSISFGEFEYLLKWVNTVFPGLAVNQEDVQATYSGVRSVIGTGKSDPSRETREHLLWFQDGMLTVTGGKLTTFRLMAHQALTSIRNYLPGNPVFDPRKPMFNLPPSEDIFSSGLSPASKLRILGRYAFEAEALIHLAHQGELESVAGLPTLWAEIRWAAHAEGVIHLDDLLLRRTRLGLLLPQGGQEYMEIIRSIVSTEMGWNAAKWQNEMDRYLHLWQKCYSHQPQGLS